MEHDSNKEGEQPPPPNHLEQTNHAQQFEIQPPDTAQSSVNTEYQNPPTLTNRQPDGNRYEAFQYPRSSETMSVQSMVNLPPPDDFRGRQSSTPMGTTVNYTQQGPQPDADLPPPDLLYNIVDLYFKHVNTWSPILDRKVTFEQLLDSPVRDEPDRILLHAIVATTLRFSKDPRLTAESRKRYHDIAKQKVLLHGLERPSVRSLQALLILALDLLGTSSGPQGRNILALLARNIVHLGLTSERNVDIELPRFASSGSLQEFILPHPTSWVEEEGQRRIFWMLYILDRYASVASGTDFTLDEAETDRPLPCRYDLFSNNEPVETRWFRGVQKCEITVNRPENLGSFSYHCEVLRILSRIHLFLRRPLDIGSLSDVERWQNTYRELDTELNRWLYNLPDDYGRISQLCHSDPTSRISNWIMLHAAFVVSVIRLHSSAAYPTVRSHIFTPSSNAMQRCLSAVESLREIAQDVVNTGMLDLLGPHFAFSLWVSARLLLVHASATESEVDGSINFFMSTLSHMSQNWELARNYVQTLDRVLQEYQASRHHPSGPSVSSPSFEPKTLCSMRR